MSAQENSRRGNGAVSRTGRTVRLAFQMRPAKQGAVASQHILFVDDEAPIRELLSLFFRKKGMDVTTAVDSAQARELATKVPFTLAIVDVNLAGENGLELLSFFKTNYPAVPVIVFTGLTGQDLVEQAMAGGANGFMRKTEPLAALFEEVSRHLPSQGVH